LEPDELRRGGSDRGELVVEARLVAVRDRHQEVRNVPRSVIDKREEKD
jgi:hypothetical protein